MSDAGINYLYDVISTAAGIEDLAQRVSRRLELGWRCVGGVSTATIVIPDGVTVLFSQAMLSPRYDAR
jgi:hypothetical protein